VGLTPLSISRILCVVQGEANSAAHVHVLYATLHVFSFPSLECSMKCTPPPHLLTGAFIGNGVAMIGEKPMSGAELKRRQRVGEATPRKKGRDKAGLHNKATCNLNLLRTLHIVKSQEEKVDKQASLVCPISASDQLKFTRVLSDPFHGIKQ